MSQFGPYFGVMGYTSKVEPYIPSNAHPPTPTPPVPSPHDEVFNSATYLRPNEVVNQHGGILQISEDVDRDHAEAERRELVRILEESSQRVGTLMEQTPDGLNLADLQAIGAEYAPGGMWYNELDDDGYQNPAAMTEAEWREMEDHTNEVDDHNIALPEETFEDHVLPAPGP